MKKGKILLPLIFCVIFILSNCTPENTSFRVMSFNIRLNIASDGKNAWPRRRELVASMIRFHKADIVGIQEALFDQVWDMEKALPEYRWLGVGRDDGEIDGEFMAIFYRNDRFELLQNSTFWLSERPEKPGRGWDAACNRIVTWGKFKDCMTGKQFYYFNTHFDHLGNIAREQSAELLLQKIKEIAADFPVVISGDFNVFPNAKPYRIIVNGTQDNSDLKLVDAKKISQNPHYGPQGTFTGFDLTNLGDAPIDYIFVKNNVTVLYHGTLSDCIDGRLPSDHFPVLAEILVE